MKLLCQFQVTFEEFMNPSTIVEEVDEQLTTEITITRFYPNDSTGSDTCMATMCIDKLKINEKGWYTL